MANKEEILAGLAEIVNEETGVEVEDVQLDKSFTEDLDIDSISMMTIVVNAEEVRSYHPRRRGQEPQDRWRRSRLHRKRSLSCNATDAARALTGPRRITIPPLHTPGPANVPAHRSFPGTTGFYPHTTG